MINDLLREATATARSQPVASALTMLMVAGMIIAVMLTTGRTVAAEQAVLSSIDSAGTRSITIRAEAAAGVTSDVLERIKHIDGIEWAGAFSSAVDAVNTAVPDGVRVPVRNLYSEYLAELGIPAHQALPDQSAYTSRLANEQLGLADGAGSITLTNGTEYAVTGSLVTPEALRSLEPLVLVPHQSGNNVEIVTLILVVAERPELVSPVSSAVLSVLAPDDPTKVTAHTSEALAQLRGLIEGQLGSFSRGLVLALLALTGTLVAILLYGLVMMRRKDYGRRRALGATRSFIVALLLGQTTILALTGIAIGLVGSLVLLASTGAPLPGWRFTLSLIILALVTALLASLVPALVASRREPIRELRVP